MDHLSLVGFVGIGGLETFGVWRFGVGLFSDPFAVARHFLECGLRM